MEERERIDRVCKRAREIASKKILLSKSDREVLLAMIEGYEKATKAWFDLRDGGRR